jgi:hypothetical protein
MKKSLLIVLATLITSSVFAEGIMEKACVKNEKTGKDVCKNIKVHKKLEVTPVAPAPAPKKK